MAVVRTNECGRTLIWLTEISFEPLTFYVLARFLHSKTPVRTTVTYLAIAAASFC